MCRGHGTTNVKYLSRKEASQGGSLSKHHCPGISSVRPASQAQEFMVIARLDLHIRSSDYCWLLYRPFRVMDRFLPKFLKERSVRI